MSELTANLTNATQPAMFCHGLRFREYHPSGLVLFNVAAGIIVNGMLAVFSFIANALVIFVVLKIPRLQTPTNILFTYMAVTDVLVSVCPIPLSAIFRFYQTRGIHLCAVGVAWAFTGYLLCVWSSTAIGIVSVDRLIAISYPLLYRKDFYRKRRTYFLLLLWFLWFVFLIFPFSRLLSFLGLNAAIFTYLVTILSSVTFCYSKIMYTLRKRMQGSTVDVRMERRYKTAGILTLAFIIAYLPRLIVTIIFFFEKNESFEIFYLSGVWSESFIYLNSAINPVLYIWRLPNVRASIFKLFQRRSAEIGRNNYAFELELRTKRGENIDGKNCI